MWRTECGQTETQTDRKVQTEGPKILSNDQINDIFFCDHWQSKKW